MSASCLLHLPWKYHLSFLLQMLSTFWICFLVFFLNFQVLFLQKRKILTKINDFGGFSPLNLEEKHWEILVTSYKFRYSDSTKCYVSLCSELPWIFLCKISYCLDLFDLNNVAHNFHLTKKKNLFQNTMNNFVIHKFLIVPTIFA